LNWLLFGKSSSIEFAEEQGSVYTHMMAVPVFLLFGFLNVMEKIFGSAYAPSVMLLAGTGMAYKVRQNRAENRENLVKKVA
jgi:hypothetical protein